MAVERRRTASTRARLSRGFTTPASARAEAREDLRGDRLELLPLVARIADRAHEEVLAAGVAERRELLGALLRGADDPVLLRQGREVLRVALREDTDPGRLRPLPVTPHGDEGEMRRGEAVERPAGGVGRLADLVEALRIALGLDDVGHPAVALAAGARQRRVGPPADPEGRELLHRLRVDRDPLEPTEPPLKRRRRVPPERADDLDGLGHARAPLRVGDAADLELLRVLAADPHAEDQATFAEDVERRRDLGGDRRRAQGQQVHGDAELDPPRDRRVGREQRERLVKRVVKGDVVAGPDRVEAELFDPSHESELLRRGMQGEVDAERSHGLLSQATPGLSPASRVPIQRSHGLLSQATPGWNLTRGPRSNEA